MNKHRIAFYIELKNAENSLVDVDLDKGNPGIGGTQYLFLLTVKKLNNFVKSNYAILLTDGMLKIPDMDENIGYVKNIKEAIKFCEENAIEVLTLNANVVEKLSLECLHTNVRLVLWAHNTLTWKRQQIAARENSIDRIVCVSKSQYINMKDTPCFEKCTFINNVIPKEFYDHATLTDYTESKVVYIGSLMPQKGVHNLIEIWKYVEEDVPEAQLYIFGGANVWNPKAENDGVCDQYYDRIIKHRLDKLKHPENIHFMGARGWDDIDYMINNMRVGIVNPSHYMRDETFCMSAIELEAHGIPIVSRERGDGLGTTVLHGKTGYLEKADIDIAKRIVSLIKDDDLCKRLGAEAREYVKQYVVDNEVGKWFSLVEDGRLLTTVIGRTRRKSQDAKLLEHDFGLKIGYLIESGKIIDLIIRRLRRK